MLVHDPLKGLIHTDDDQASPIFAIEYVHSEGYRVAPVHKDIKGWLTSRCFKKLEAAEYWALAMYAEYVK